MSLDNVSVILVKPQMGENIGATARVMKNFGITDLRIISPRDGWPNPKAEEMSAHADDIIKNAKIFDNLNSAIEDINYLISTSATKRFLSKEIVAPEKAAQNIIKIIPNKKCGILFGRESIGLTNEEISPTYQMVTIPISDLYPSINLSQAVGIILYEIFKNNNSKDKKELKINLFFKHKNKNSTKVDLKNFNADRKDYLSLIEFLEKRLEEKNFFQIKEKKKKMMINITNIFTKNNFTEQEIRTLKGIFSLIK